MILALILVSVLGNICFAQQEGDKIFEADTLHVLRISSETIPNLYEKIQNDALNLISNRPYYEVNISFDGEETNSVGVRAKGYNSATDPDQSPMKIDINEYVSDQTFDGIKKFGLSNSLMDQYRQKDRVSYELFRRAGIPSPRTSYAEVFVNDEFIEIYLLVEQINKSFIKEHFADEGSLIKIEEIKYGNDQFADVIFEESPNRLQRVELRQYFKFILVNSILTSLDNYPDNNYYIYYSEKENRYHYLPWDYNLVSFYQGEPILPPIADFTSIWNNPDMKAKYFEVACEFYNYLLNQDFIENLTSKSYSVITSNTQGSTVEGGQDIIQFLEVRRNQLLQELSDNDYTCGDFSYPYEAGDLVINEFVAKSDSTGVQEPDGGTPDWIELYNNTDEDIILNHHFYLSNNPNFPKKWKFETPVTIPANGYQIIWADRDVHQQGVHASFKINKSSGNLMLVYEDMTVIDQVEYEEQEKNMGYARVPNGTGDFVIQSHTFNANNNDDGTSTTSKLAKKESIKVYPNPASETVQIITSNSIENLEVFSFSGQKIIGQKGDNSSIDLTNIPSGMYFLHIQTVGQNNVFKLIKK